MLVFLYLALNSEQFHSPAILKWELQIPTAVQKLKLDNLRLPSCRIILNLLILNLLVSKRRNVRMMSTAGAKSIDFSAFT